MNTMLESVKTSSRNEEHNRDMTDFEVNSADYWESCFERDWAQTQGCEQTRYFARILLDHLPSWLEDEIPTNRSICDWGCAEGEAVEAFRTHFPESRIRGIERSHNALRKARYKFGTEYFIGHDVLTAPLPTIFDVLASSNVLQYFQTPWPVLRTLGIHAAHHLLMLVPYREENRVREHLYTFETAQRRPPARARVSPVVAQRLSASGGDLSRRALEALVADGGGGIQAGSSHQTGSSETAWF